MKYYELIDAFKYFRDTMNIDMHMQISVNAKENFQNIYSNILSIGKEDNWLNKAFKEDLRSKLCLDTVRGDISDTTSITVTVVDETGDHRNKEYKDSAGSPWR